YTNRWRWTDTAWGTLGQMDDFVRSRVVTDITNWYNAETARFPHFRLTSHNSLGEIIAETLASVVWSQSYGAWWEIFDPWLTVRYTRPAVTFAIGKEVWPAPRIVTPDPITVDPPPFALGNDKHYSVADIKGRLVIDGSGGFSGDKLIVHNEDGTVSTGAMG